MPAMQRNWKKEERLGGFDSDSEDNAYDSDRSKQSEKNQSEDDDMFASGSEDNGFNMDEFEKEHQLGKFDPDRKAAEVLAQLGDDEASEIPIESFDLRREHQEGTFDEEMNYHKNVNSDSENEEDVWMAGVDKNDINEASRKAKASKSKPQARAKRDMEESLKILIDILDRTETPLEALVRYGQTTKTKLRRGSRKSPALSRSQSDKTAVYNVTEACDDLEEDGIADIYEKSREELMRMYSRVTGVDFQSRGTKRTRDDEPEAAEPQVKTSDTELHGVHEEESDYGEKVWRFRWIDSEEVHGPYLAYEMDYWKKTYFENSVEVQRVGSTTWTHVEHTHFGGPDGDSRQHS